jgi:Rrf2 family nitric oxide-sensitive transcriptional repressor
MQLSMHTDFACRVLIYLSLKPRDELSSIKNIAEAYGISENHLVKVVHQLGQHGFIETVRGRGGGLRLARDPATISMGDVVRKMEASLALLECFRDDDRCQISTACALKPWVGKALDAFLAVLDAVSLQEVTANRRALSKQLATPYNSAT